jgi:hypothetical protein
MNSTLTTAGVGYTSKRKGTFDAKRSGGALIHLLDRRNAQILADLVGQYVNDLGVAGNGRPAILRRVMPP